MRRGFTLVELLVVITILLLITAATIPILAPGTETRRQREAARLVSSALSGAQARAIARNTSVGVWIERDPGARYAATVLYSCEVPPPYTGDSTDTRVRVIRTPTPEFLNPMPGLTPQPADNDYLFFCATLARGSWSDGMIQVGDSLQFNNQGLVYQIHYGLDSNRDGFIDGNLYNPSGARPMPQNHRLIQPPTNPFLILKIPKRFKHPTAGHPNYESEQPYVYSGSMMDENQRHPEYKAGYLPWPPVWDRDDLTSRLVLSGELPFRITRQPQKTHDAPVRLPEGAVIDLRFSGLDEDFGGRFFGESNTNNPPGLQPWSVQGPLIVLFSAQGELQNVYTVGAPSLSAVPSSVHFLIGKRERIMDDIPTDRTDDLSDLLLDITTQFNDDVRNLPDERQLNFQDMQNFWVTVQKGNGLPTVSQAASIPENLAVVSDMPRPPDTDMDGQPNYAPGWQPANWEFITWINSTRRLARRSMVDGGQ